jgi:hypothetical protein
MELDIAVTKHSCHFVPIYFDWLVCAALCNPFVLCHVQAEADGRQTGHRGCKRAVLCCFQIREHQGADTRNTVLQWQWLL